jgi:hypothetical protein
MPSKDTGRRRSGRRPASRTRASAQPSKRLPALPGRASKRRGSRSVALTARLRAGRSTATRRARFVATVGKKRLAGLLTAGGAVAAQSPLQTSTGPRAARRRTGAGDHHRHPWPNGGRATAPRPVATPRARQRPSDSGGGRDPAPPSASRTERPPAESAACANQLTSPARRRTSDTPSTCGASTRTRRSCRAVTSSVSGRTGVKPTRGPAAAERRAGPNTMID